jgi:hypothetical protein
MESQQKEAFEIISRNFEIQKTDGFTLDDARNLLAVKIRELIDTNMEKLLSILYRIDVSQKKTDEIFDIESKDEIAIKLADAVIDRQLLKVKTRKHYRKPGEA